eukprot:Skav233074  [mRNA]  locus=scaffold1468:236049:236705:- [translate_table: standard]
MEKREKLSSCIAFGIRRAKQFGHEVAAQHLWRALHSVTLADSAMSPTPVQLCLFDALKLGVAEQHQAVQTSRLASRLELEAAMAHPTAAPRSEVATQTSEVIVTAKECKLLAEDIAKKEIEEALAPVQAMVDQLRALQPAVSQNLRPQVTSTSSNSTTAIGFRASEARSSYPSSGHTGASLTPPAGISQSDTGIGQRAQQKEARRNARKAELLAKLAS